MKQSRWVIVAGLICSSGRVSGRSVCVYPPLRAGEGLITTHAQHCCLGPSNMCHLRNKADVAFKRSLPVPIDAVVPRRRESLHRTCPPGIRYGCFRHLTRVLSVEWLRGSACKLAGPRLSGRLLQPYPRQPGTARALQDRKIGCTLVFSCATCCMLRRRRHQPRRPCIHPTC